MLASFRQSYQCTCKCLLQNSSRGLSVSSVTKYYEHPSTATFIRKAELGQVGVGRYPLIKLQHTVLYKLKPKGDYKSTMKCILTKEIDGIGLQGTVVEVPKRVFRNCLYPSGSAVYASPENLSLYEAIRKESDDGEIDYETKQMMRKMAGFHVRVFMHPTNEWILEPRHLRIAFRKMGVMLDEDNIIMPEEIISDFGDFTFKLQMFNKIACRLQGTIYPLRPDGLPPSDKSFPPIWTKNVSNTAIEYLNRSDSNTAKSDDAKETKVVEEVHNKDIENDEKGKDD